jgi:Spy/CpxP family protein refolding chaperone
MKKLFVALALIAGLAVTTAAMADWGRGGRGHGGYGDCPQMQGQMFQQLDQATQDKIKQFRKDILPLRKEMAMKRAEKKALMKSSTPDAQAVARLAGEMFDIRTTIHEKAELAGVDQYIGPGRMGGMGRKGHMGHMGRGGQGPCFGAGPGAGGMMEDKSPQQ